MGFRGQMAALALAIIGLVMLGPACAGQPSAPVATQVSAPPTPQPTALPTPQPTAPEARPTAPAVVVEPTPVPASLAVVANTVGARVLLDGVARGEVPLKLSGLAPGSHELRLEKEGFKPWTGFLWLVPGQIKQVQADLAAFEMTQIDPEKPIGALAVQVENHVDARPQSGLDRANVVYEAMVEGGISRFLALYLKGSAPVVGPIRSARHYFVAWAREYDASLVHIGASPQGYRALRAAGVPTLDEAMGHSGIWRSRNRAAPHNAYSSTSAMRRGLAGRGAEGSWGGLKFKDPEWRYSGEPAPEITIDYGWNYLVGYSYDLESNQYLRSMVNAPHRDLQTGEQLRASSVAVMTVPAWVIDSVGRLDMALTGSGKGDYFLDGVHLTGTWHKETLGGPTRFLGPDGKVIHFNPGPLWIQVLPATAHLDF